MPTFGAPTGSPFGVGSAIAAPVPPLGRADLSRYVSPGTGSAEIDASTGHLQSMPAVRQRMLLLARTLRGSSAIPEFGVDLPAVIDDTFARRVDASVRAAAAQMTEIEKVARIDSVEVTTTALGRANIVISYTDLDLRVTDTVAVQR